MRVMTNLSADACATFAAAEVVMALRTWIACVLASVFVGCAPYPQPCDDGTFDGDVDQGRETFEASGFDGNYWVYSHPEALERFAKCRIITGHLSGATLIEERFFPNLQHLGSFGTYTPSDQTENLDELVGFDSITELGGVLGTILAIEGFAGVRTIGRLEGYNIRGFNNLEFANRVDSIHPTGLTSLETAGSIRLKESREQVVYFPNLARVERELIVVQTQLEDISFPSIEEVNGDVWFAGNGFATQFDGFATNSSVLGSFNFYGHQFLNSDYVNLRVSEGRPAVFGGQTICRNQVVNGSTDTCPADFVEPILLQY